MRILITEDEPVIAQRIERLTRSILGSRITSVKICRTLAEANSFLIAHQIDLLFLDLNLKGEDGFQILDNAEAQSFYTVIISAYSEKAVRAFDYPVIDFIEKPFDRDRLAKTFERLNNFDAKNNFTSKFLSLRRAGEIVLIDVEKIVYIKGAGVYSDIFLEDGKKELHHNNLEKIDVLLPANFQRIHKSYIVNFYYVQSIMTHGGSRYSIKLKTGDELPVSRARYPELKTMLAGHK